MVNQPIVTHSSTIYLFFIGLEIDFQFTNSASDTCFICFHSLKSGVEQPKQNPPPILVLLAVKICGSRLPLMDFFVNIVIA